MNEGAIMKIYDYFILMDETVDGLVKKVKTMIETEHWEPIGGMSIEVYPHFSPKYYQTMVYTKKT